MNSETTPLEENDEDFTPIPPELVAEVARRRESQFALLAQIHEEIASKQPAPDLEIESVCPL